MSGMGFGNFSGGGNTGTRNPLLVGNGAQSVLSGNGTFYSYVLPANSLSTNGDYLVIETGATLSGVGGSAVLSVTFAGTTLASRTWIEDGSPEDIVIQITLSRVSAAAIRTAGWLSWSLQSGANFNYLPSSIGAAVDLTTSNTIAVTATGYGAGTLTGQYFSVASYLITG